MRPEMDEEFAQFVRSTQHQLLRAAYLVCGDIHLAEDLLQQAFLKVALRWESLRSGAPGAYVRRILYRDAVSTWRRTRREQLDGGPFELFADTETTAAIDQRLDIETALLQLTPRQRAVIVLRFFEDRSEREAAEALGVSVGTVKSQTHDTLARLRTLMPEFADSLNGWES
ncbi:MAG TPA: SigE family RNA polymerase sigma factor [Dermatophilaceae bacterium]|jgi:RNA polymerase sigma-70 factor (sigma-E family)|nr:SigE family RNA polymerase sigma factor [Dermatophilaceae bacterium]